MGCWGITKKERRTRGGTFEGGHKDPSSKLLPGAPHGFPILPPTPLWFRQDLVTIPET